MTASNIEVFRAVPPVQEKLKAEKISMTKPVEKPLPEAKSAQPSAGKTDNKTAKSDKPAKTEKKVLETKKASEEKKKMQAKPAR